MGAGGAPKAFGAGGRGMGAAGTIRTTRTIQTIPTIQTRSHSSHEPERPQERRDLAVLERSLGAEKCGDPRSSNPNSTWHVRHRVCVEKPRTDNGRSNAGRPGGIDHKLTETKRRTHPTPSGSTPRSNRTEA